MNSFLSLHTGEEEKTVVLANIRSGIVFRGANVWVLACAIMIASIGLNLNSTAVVIGAMLISPLMAPIIGAGFAMAIFDFSLLNKSLQNLLVSTLVGLGVSTLYFMLTPYKQLQPELLMRTSPTIYDVLIAFFGGVAGAIAITRHEKGNPLAGAAIATALMPPLCTAGYGLATGQWYIMGGALYLYGINCVFICIATYGLARYMKYPRVGFVSESRARRVGRWVTLITVMMIVPSIFLAYRFLKKQQFEEKVKIYVQREFTDKGNTIIYSNTEYAANAPRKIELAFLIRRFTGEQIAEENKKLAAYGLNDTKLLIRQDTAFLKAKQNNTVGVGDINVKELKSAISSSEGLKADMFKEAQAIFPQLTALAAGRQSFYSGTDTAVKVPVAVYQSAKPLDAQSRGQLERWLKLKLNTDTLKMFSTE